MNRTRAVTTQFTAVVVAAAAAGWCSSFNKGKFCWSSRRQGGGEGSEDTTCRRVGSTLHSMAFIMRSVNSCNSSLSKFETETHYKLHLTCSRAFMRLKAKDLLRNNNAASLQLCT